MLSIRGMAGAARLARGSVAALAMGASALVAFGAQAAQANEKVDIAALAFVSSAPLFIAKEKGYLADEGLDAEISIFQAAQPVAVAIASGDADFGVTAFTGGFFNLAAKGALKVIGAQLHEDPGYDGSAILASNAAFEAGLTSVDKLPGHSFALSQVGSSFHYMIGNVAEKAGFDPESVSLKPLQSVPNMIGALKSGQVDSMIIVPHIAKPLANAGAAHIIGWVKDYVPYQVGGLFTSTENVEENREMVEKFVRAYQKGVADYRAALLATDADGKLTESDTTQEILEIVHKYVYANDPADKAYPKIRNGAMFITEEARLDVADVKAQVKWYQDRGFVSADADPAKFIDTSFIPALTE
ncbi:ABC transporter substrate-binding protein [Thalassospira xiamenensis]|uniref:ABC transporter substrate-binding protein n=1 Tax=Thalassospira xiamenensis TaxID=220697 RepID=UPI000DFFB0C1|nr:ABC transporter substrate-binding protein [Thalassospira xiamenensis]RCK34231.1 ABC transporter substrate-binding protein [Thalassospira xiamenensis]